MNEKRLIDANALNRTLHTIAMAFANEYGNLGGAVSGVIMHIDNAPTVDAVEVVRCKDCAYFVADYCCRDINGRRQMHYMGAEAFCSYGERKEG